MSRSSSSTAGFGDVRSFSPEKMEFAPARKHSAWASPLRASRPADSRTRARGAPAADAGPHGAVGWDYAEVMGWLEQRRAARTERAVENHFDGALGKMVIERVEHDSFF